MKKYPVSITRDSLSGEGLEPLPPFPNEEEVTLEGSLNHRGKTLFDGDFSAKIYEADPAKLRIDDFPIDEYILVLEGRLILTDDNGEVSEYKPGDSLVIPKGFSGYWHMPEKYREFIIIDSSPYMAE